ncbi:MAG: 3D domain-containing protein [Firmicutes bacterium]|nr:3D domain-containing protein [Bacillota bacterium]
MTKAKGVWICPTVLGEVAEATVVAAPLAPKQPSPQISAQKSNRKAQPFLTVALGVCCSLMIGLIGLHTNILTLPLPPLIETVSASQIFPDEGSFATVMTGGRDFVRDLATAQAIPIDIGKAEQDADVEQILLPEEELTENNADIAAYIDELATMVAQPERAFEEQPVLASRSGGNAYAGEITVGEQNYMYTRRLSMESTAYTWTGNRTATGTWPRVPTEEHPGTIAVDPQIIPLGSKLFVDGYGLGIAEDTGGLINGNIIDVYFNTRYECIMWGRKYGVTVYILK